MELPQLRFEQASDDGMSTGLGETRAISIICRTVDGAVDAGLRVDSEELGPPVVRLGERVWRWQWHPRGRAGRFTAVLTVVDGEARVWHADQQLDIGSAHLDPCDYDELLGAVQRAAAGLVYSLAGGLQGASPELEQSGPRSIIEGYWTRLVSEMRLATGIVRTLERAPQHAQRHLVRESPLSELRALPAETLARAPERPIDELLAMEGEPFTSLLPRGSSGRARLPRSLPVRETEKTSQIYEHQLLVHILDEIEHRRLLVREELRRELHWREHGGNRAGAEEVVHALQAWDQKIGSAGLAIRRCRESPILQEVEPATTWRGTTPLMRRDPRYRRIAELWRLLYARPFVASLSPAYDLPVADSPALYELWCLLEVARALDGVGTLAEQKLVQPYGDHQRRGGYVWKLTPVENAPLLKWHTHDGGEITLFRRRRYNPHIGQSPQLGSLDPFLRIPDVAIEVTPPGERPWVLIFDAKYRRTPAGTIPEEVLGDAYTYKSAIGFAGVPTARGVYLLFPGSQGFEGGDVGAIALRPGGEGALHDLLRRRLGFVRS